MKWKLLYGLILYVLMRSRYDLEFDVDVFGDYLVVGEDGDVFEYGFVVIVEIWCFHCRYF